MFQEPKRKYWSYLSSLLIVQFFPCLQKTKMLLTVLPVIFLSKSRGFCKPSDQQRDCIKGYTA